MNLTSKHPRRLQTDHLGDELYALFSQDRSLLTRFRQLSNNTDLERFIVSDSVIEQKLQAYLTIQVNEEEVRNGQVFFAHLAQPILFVLGFYSLPYCYAAGNGARVLTSSHKVVLQPYKRLLETAEFVFDACSPGGFGPSGKAQLSILKVRLMHAAVRFGARNIITDEIPINQEDMLGTLMAFSLIVIRGIRRMGFEVSENECEAYLRLWNVIGQQMGVEPSYLPQNMRTASAIDRDIRKREFRSSKEGQLLINSLLIELEKHRDPNSFIRAKDVLCFFLERHAQLFDLQPSNRLSSLIVQGFFKSQGYWMKLNKRSYDGLRKDLRKQLMKLNTELQF